MSVCLLLQLCASLAIYPYRPSMNACRRLSLQTPNFYSRTSTAASLSDVFVPESPECEYQWGPGEVLPHNNRSDPSPSHPLLSLSKTWLITSLSCRDYTALLRVILKGNFVILRIGWLRFREDRMACSNLLAVVVQALVRVTLVNAGAHLSCRYCYIMSLTNTVRV